MTASPSDFWDHLQAALFSTTVRALAGINLCLAIDRIEPLLQRAAAYKYVRPDYLTLRMPSNGQATEGEFFARAGVLTAIKSLMAVRRVEPDVLTFDPNLVGDLSLDANEIAFADRRSDPPNLTDRDVMVQSLSVWDIYNPRFLGYSLARGYRMLEIAEGNDETVGVLRAKLGWSSEPPEFDGMSLDDFAAVVFGLFAHVTARAQRGALLGPPGGFIVDANMVFQGAPSAKPLLDGFLRRRSLSFEQLRQRIAGSGGWLRDEFMAHVSDPGFATDFRVFRQFPIVDLGQGEHLILDMQFLEELIGTGLFFNLLGQLDSKRRKALLDLWGRVFEILVVELLQHYYPRSRYALLPAFASGYKFHDNAARGVGEGEVDAFLDFGSEIIVFEMKHFFIPQEVKDALNYDRLWTELRLKLVEDENQKPKAIRQIVNIARAIRSGAIPTAQGACDTYARTAVLYPVIVVADPGLEAFGVNTLLNEVFQEYAADVPGGVRPLTIMSVQEVEEVLAFVSAGVFTWSEVLESRFEISSSARRVRLWSVHQATYDLARLKGAPLGITSQFRKDQFTRIGSQMVKRFGPA